MKHKQPRAVGILRVSQVGGRSTERFHSPDIQREKITEYAARTGLDLVEVYDESRSVSGGADLENRPGLRQAVARVEDDDVQVIVVSTLDRAFRSLDIQRAVLRRINAAGGELHAVDEGGPVKVATAAQRFGVDVQGLVAELHREVSREKAREGQVRAVARGAVPFKNVPIGYRRSADGTLEVYEPEVPIVREMFDRRLRGESAETIRAWLFSVHGVDRTARGVMQGLTNTLYIGKLVFGDLVNEEACEPLVDRAVFDAVQTKIIPRGRGTLAPSPRLLARQGILRCGTCQSRLVVDSAGAVAIYRCRNTRCPQKVAVKADEAETRIVGYVQEKLSGIAEASSADEGVQAASEALETAQRAFNGAVEAFTGLGDVPAVAAKLQALKAAVDDAQAAYDEALARQEVQGLTVSADDWGVLSLDERRDLIRALVASASVAPSEGRGRSASEARGADRLTIIARA